MTSSVVIIILSGIIVIQMIQIGMLLYWLMNRGQQRSRSTDATAAPVTAESVALVTQALKDAEAIVQHAVDAAETILYDAEHFRTKIDNELQFAIKDATNERKEDFSALLESAVQSFRYELRRLQREYHQETSEAIDEIKALSQAEMEHLRSHSNQHRDVIEAYLDRRLREELREMKQALRNEIRH